MSKKQEVYVSMAEVRDMLTEASEKRGELIPIQADSLDNAQETCSIDKETAEKIVKEAMEKLDFVDESAKKRIAYKIADVLPKYPNDVRAIFYKERITMDDAKIQTVLDIVKENA